MKCPTVHSGCKSNQIYCRAFGNDELVTVEISKSNRMACVNCWKLDSKHNKAIRSNEPHRGSFRLQLMHWLNSSGHTFRERIQCGSTFLRDKHNKQIFISMQMWNHQSQFMDSNRAKVEAVQSILASRTKQSFGRLAGRQCMKSWKVVFRILIIYSFTMLCVVSM